MKRIFNKIKSIDFIINHKFNSDNKLRAILRILKWQLLCFVTKKSIIVEWVDDSVFITKKGETSLTGNIYVGLFEFIDMTFLLHLLRKNDLFIDVGANQGSYTILAGKVIGANVITYEPVESTFKKLLSNIYINNIKDNVNAKQIGIGEKITKEFITNNLDAMNHIVLEKNQTNFDPITIKTLDSEIDIDTIKGNIILKIDVEGYELNVLRGATKLLYCSKLIALIIEINKSCSNYNNNESEIEKLVTGCGFFPITYDPVKREILNIKSFDKSKNNTLYIRNHNVIRERILSSKKYKIHTLDSICI